MSGNFYIYSTKTQGQSSTALAISKEKEKRKKKIESYYITPIRSSDIMLHTYFWKVGSLHKFSASFLREKHYWIFILCPIIATLLKRVSLFLSLLCFEFPSLLISYMHITVYVDLVLLICSLSPYSRFQLCAFSASSGSCICPLYLLFLKTRTLIYT